MNCVNCMISGSGLVSISHAPSRSHPGKYKNEISFSPNSVQLIYSMYCTYICTVELQQNCPNALLCAQRLLIFAQMFLYFCPNVSILLPKCFYNFAQKWICPDARCPNEICSAVSMRLFLFSTTAFEIELPEHSLIQVKTNSN